MRRTLLRIAATAAVSALTVPLLPGLAQAAPVQGGKGKGTQVLVVSSGKDDGSKGTLRWALQESNSTSAVERIEITAAAGIIRLTGELPAITAPVTITGTAGKRGGHPAAGIDGSGYTDTSTTASCPGWTSGSGPNVRSITSPGLQVVDSGGVVIKGLTIRNFCIGILSLRSHDNTFTGNLIQNSIGAAGIEVTGDDGTGGVATGASVRNTVSDNVFLNNGDAMEFTRGTTDGLISGNTFLTDDTAPAGLVRSASIEFAGSGNDRNTIIGNRFLGGMSDALQLFSGADNLVKNNVIRGYANAVTAGGTGLRIEGNEISGNHMGVNSTSGTPTITRNSIHDNGADISLCNAGGICDTNSLYETAKLGIDLAARGVTANDALDADNVQNHPVVTSVTRRADGSLRVTGVLDSKASRSYRVELFANRTTTSYGYGEGDTYAGAAVVTTDSSGHATFTITVPRRCFADRQKWLTATATDLVDGPTSEFSASFPLG
ncbi:right-handed parallel beta-helix repeat-containing protein [Streptomyces sp. AS02]|uniref:right-handed parallel beta-helix repeat-containing protein n=1 Tax=Streptomyces sp. AS02 TaxID=2938946 RepID=UPI0020221A94|nr:right-handed parallel beta-helix repeat-containing protein [Streptomyces sp. AS02]MCL8014888.1 right-handed parallel beta-helix repeat-containing protein [Streptomyces sp. AS02]